MCLSIDLLLSVRRQSVAAPKPTVGDEAYATLAPGGGAGEIGAQIW
jgi:hypothetical protein